MQRSQAEYFIRFSYTHNDDLRQIIYTVDLQTFLKCIKGEIYAQNLPADVKIVAGYFSVEKQCFQLILESDDFPEKIPCYPLETRHFYFERIIN